MHHGDLAEKFAGGIGGGVLGIEDDIGDVANPELQAVIPLQRLALNLFAVDEGSMFAALVDDAKFTVFRDDQGVVAGHARVGND